MIIAVFLGVLVTYILTLLWKRRRIYALHEMLKNETWSLPILGNFLEFVGGGEARMKALQRFGRIAIRQGGMTSLWLGPKYFVVVADPEIAAITLKTCLEKSEMTKIGRELMGNGTLFASQKIWRPRRKVIAPTFNLKNLNRFVEVFGQQSSTMAAQLKKSAGKGTFSVWKYLTTYAMDSVCETTLGVRVNTQVNPEHPFFDAYENHFRMGSFRIFLPPVCQKAYKYFPIYKQYLRDIHYMHSFVDEIVKSKRKELSEKEVRIQDLDQKPSQQTFLELFIESSGGTSGFTDLELREETLVLVLAGTDTSAVAASFLCLMLVKYPEIQEKAYEEIREVLGDSDEPITAETLPKLPYLEAIIKETMRLYPPAPAVYRNVDEDLQLPSGLTLVKDTTLLINIWAIHRNPAYWGDDAEEFRPERFLSSDPIHSAAFIPFSHGPRSCVGYRYAMMSLKTVIATLLRHYRLLPALDDNNEQVPLQVKYEIMMKHIGNYELRMELRRR